MKIRKFISTVLACMGACAMCTACGAEPRVNKIAEYHGQNTDPVTGKMTINEALFYRNDKKTDGADPFVLDNTSRDGYYYAYTTHDYIYCFRSKDLMYWEPVGNTLQPEIGSEAARVLYKDRWAAEVVYDDGTYYMF